MIPEQNDASRALALDLLSFIDAGPTPFHAVAEAERRLMAAGFTRLSEADPWSLAAGGQHYVVRGGGTLVAFRVGQVPATSAGFHIVGAHTDAPNLRLKPRYAKESRGCLVLDVEPYGGLIVATWADRDLGLAGRVQVEVDGQLESRLIRIDEPICRVPNLAIHLNRTVNDEGLKLDKHRHLMPVAALMGAEAPEARLAALVAERAQVSPDQIMGHDLCLFDTQPSSLIGLDQGLISAPRLDDLAMCHAGLTALLSAPTAPSTAVLCLFDHEECGSTSARGAQGSLLTDVLARLAGETPFALVRAASLSQQISADMAHAVHPAYGDLHDGTHAPKLNGGPVIKTNVNQRYATDGESGAFFRRLCRLEEVPYQEFVNRPDLACGSTIGALTASATGISTVDVGNPMWGMHSIRELGGAQDPSLMTRALTAFFAGR